MLKRRKQNILLGMFALLFGVLFSPVAVFADVDSLLTSFGKASSVKDVNSIITTYCSAMNESASFVKDSFVYNAKYSSFVYLLCSHVGNPPSGLDTYFARKDFDQLGLLQLDDVGYELCQGLTPDCDISRLTSSLFNAIITDYVNMKQSNIYGLSSYATSDQAIENQANLFSQAYFGLKICESKDPAYPTTCRTLKSYITKTHNLLGYVDIFDVESLLRDTMPLIEENAQIYWDPIRVSPSDAMASCSSKDASYNILLCGLYGDTSTSFVSFVNLVYNELFYYRLFVGYYLTMIQKHPGILSESTSQRNYTTISKKFSTEYTRSKSALSLTFRMMRDMYTAFPFHIGLLMYKENLDGLGKHIAGIAPPIYTLYDKLRNVQAPQ